MQDIEGCRLMMCNTTDVVQSQSRSKRKISQVSKLVQLLFRLYKLKYDTITLIEEWSPKKLLSLMVVILFVLDIRHRKIKMLKIENSNNAV